MDFVVFFTVEFLIFVVGALAFGYCLLSCTSIYDSRNYQVSKENVTPEIKYRQHGLVQPIIPMPVLHPPY